MQPSRQAPRRLLHAAASPSIVIGMLLLGAASGQATQEVPQQAPAPVVRIHPRPQSTVPAEAPPEATPRVTRTRPGTTTPSQAPPDAAPLAPRPPRPRPVNPQALSGIVAPTGQTDAGAPKKSPAVPATASQEATPKSASTPATHATPENNAAQGSAPAASPRLSPVLNRTYIVLDPGHGGTDSGSRIGDSTLEKNVTLALAFRLRSLLTARGFTVVLTRDSDAVSGANAPGNPLPVLSLDNRAGTANHFRAAACLLLHATGRGTGVHLYTSELEAAPFEVSLLPWLTAQAAWIPASQQLSATLGSALSRSGVPLVTSSASIRPVDSLTCPAVVLELAPENAEARSVNDAGYQERVAAAVAGALVFWQNQVQAPPKLPSPLPATRPHHHPNQATAIAGEAQP